MGCAEEGVVLDIGGTSAGAEATSFVFDEEFADDLLAEAAENWLDRARRG